jgi:hypothetical protein
MAILHCEIIGRLYRKIGGIDLFMYGFWDYWKHNILNQIRLAKSADCLPECTPGDLLGQ